jgi:hypothetical protein
MTWVSTAIKEIFTKPLQSVGFHVERPLLTWDAEGERFSRGDLGIEIALTAESGNRVEIWLRHLGAERFSKDVTWSREDISLEAFCERNGLAVPVASPSLSDKPERGGHWEVFFENNLEILLRAVDMLPMSDI